MNYLFGNFDDRPLTPASARELCAEARSRTRAFASVPIQRVIETLGRLNELWQPGGRYFERGLKLLETELTFSPEMIKRSLRIVPELCRADALRARLRAEFGTESIVDRFVPHPVSRVPVLAVPHGVLLHVSAGNIFLGCIDSLLTGFLTKNVSIVKLSSRNRAFPALFAESLLEADLDRVLTGRFALVQWKGGDSAIESVFKSSVDAILAWGGAEMVKAYRNGLPAETLLIEHGPKISFQVVGRKALELAGIEKTATRIAREIVLWDQSACASPQNLFIEDGVESAPLMNAIAAELERAALRRGMLTEDDQVEILKERERLRFHALTRAPDGPSRWREGADWLVGFDPEPGLRPSPLFRTLILKTFRDLEDLETQVRPYGRYLQSCSSLLEPSRREEFHQRLARAGVQRFTALGSVLEGKPGAPHDGRLPLSELVRLVGDERDEDESIFDFVNRAIREVPYYRELYSGREIRSAAELIPIQGKNLPQALDPGAGAGGYYFSSGGTTGKPKFAYFSTAEFDTVGLMLARGLRAQGIWENDVCANLFVAGNLWSSFLAVESALKHAGAIQLPIGGLAEPDLVLDYLLQFRPKLVAGLPTLLASLAERSRARGLDLTIPMVCYAGEHLNSQAQALFEAVWKTRSCHSLGYASVDAGPIGYQCPFNGPREHHLFPEVHLEVVDGEAVITSRVKQTMPVIHLRTGDQVSWSRQYGDGERCGCGSRDPVFTLHGRLDGQINLWSSRILAEEIEAGLGNAGVKSALYQIQVREDELRVLIEKSSAHSPLLSAGIEQSIYLACKDLRITHPFEEIRSKLKVEFVPPGGIERVARTGKIRPVVDLRVL